MSYLNKIFQSVPVKIPDRSGFDLSHEVLSTAKVGTVVPITHFEVIPGDTITMGSLMKVTLPPMAVPFMGRIDAELTAAFIPYRLLWAGWEPFITQNDGTQGSSVHQGASVVEANPDNGTPSVGGTGPNVPSTVPYVTIDSNANSNGLVGPGSLADYLGCKSSRNGVNVSALPFLAYHKFCDDWIRDDNNMRPFFPKSQAFMGYMGYQVSGSNGSGGLNGQENTGRFLPTNMYNNSYRSLALVLSPQSPFPPGQGSAAGETWPFDTDLGLGSLRQRCWAKDYFTTATTRPQAGAASQVRFATVTDLTDGSGTGAFTINSLRAANSLQKWMERNNISGSDYGDQIMSHFGVRPPDAVLSRSVLLGSVRTPVYVGSVENNTGTGSVNASGAAVGTSSPFGNTLGAAAGFASGSDKGSLIDSFSPREHGVIMVFFTLIPHAYYNTGLIRSLMHYRVGDFAFPEFSNIGDQAIFQSELNGNNTDLSGFDYGNVFGYNQRYSEYKFLPDRISGLVSDGQSLEAYALQRSFPNTDQSLGKTFLTIPTNFLDGQLGVSSEIGGFGCMIDAFFNCKALRVLPEYSLPSLCQGDI